MWRPDSSATAVSEICEEAKATSPAQRGFSIPYAAIGAIVALLDTALIVATSFVTGFAYHAFALDGGADLFRFAAAGLVVAAIFVYLFQDRGHYSPNAIADMSRQIRTVTAYWTAAMLIFMGATFALKVSQDFSRGSVISFGFFGLTLLLGHHALWRRFVRIGLQRRTFRGRKSILIETSASQNGEVLGDLAAAGFDIEHHFFLNSSSAPLNFSEEVIARARGTDIEEIFVTADELRWREIDSVAKDLSVLPIPVTFIPDKSSARLLQRPPRQFANTFGIEFHRPPLTWAERSLKRLVDIACATVGLVLLMPIFVIVAIMIKIDSSGPVLFVQTRQGFNSKRFGILKFRTMNVLDDGETIKQAERGDARVTRVGLWLRRTSIDELPQLFNVLLGNMSIVGPRPHALAHDNYYSDVISSYAFRHHVKPGITGWAQVNGYRGETPTVELMKERVDLDLWYVDNWSILLDIQIILKTALEVVRGRNAY
jgi:putative colanic acid biosynthesis UDP-glucose lipid carrier transferase